MNQALIFNDDISFDQQQDAWRFTAILSGQRITIYFHSMQLKQLGSIDSYTKYDLEEVVERWLEKNEPDGGSIHINMR